jgi:hypothetical protein
MNYKFTKVSTPICSLFQILITELDTPSSLLALRSSMNTIILLGNEGSNHLCSLLAREGGVRGMLRHCSNAANSAGADTPEKSEVRVLALRGLSSICCVADCIREFEHVSAKVTIIANLCALLTMVIPNCG